VSDEKPDGLEIIRRVIEEHYDVGAVQRPEQMPSAHQRRHRKLVVQTDAGKFLCKTYSTDLRVLDNLRFQHRLSDHLHAHGLPVARILRAKNGKGIVELATWALELQHFVEGGGMQITTPNLITSARALGKFHAVCRDFPVPPRDARMWRFSEVPRGVFEKLYRIAWQQSPTPQIADACNRIALFLKEAQAALSLEKRGEFETGLIHGDWHGGNLLFRGEELVAIVDLEFAGDGCYLEDIAYGLSNLCVRTSVNPQQLRERVYAVLDYYQFHRSLAFAEMVALYYAVGIKHVATVSYQTQQAGGKIAGFTAAEWIFILDFQTQWLAEQSRKTRFGEA
jgi:Ser/Thr protein kinase RdoA (MazF antagonist)